EEAGCPDPVQAAWLYAQMVRWGQTVLSPEALKTAMGVFRPDLYDAAVGRPSQGGQAAGFSAFTGPAFNPGDVAGYLASFEVAHRRR
ncbi:nitrate transporter, partial [Bradyrhizobium guangdongense]